MPRPLVSPWLVLTILPLLGCEPATSPHADPGALARDPSVEGLEDPSVILKAVNESVKTGGPLISRSGLSRNATLVGSHWLKTRFDVPVSTAVQSEKATIGFGGRKLTVEFDKGRVVLNDAGNAKLPAGTKEVEVHFLGGKLTVKADGTTLSIPGAPG